MKTIKIEIKVKWGSYFQEKTATDALTMFLKAWHSMFEVSHKENEVSVTIDDKPLSECV